MYILGWYYGQSLVYWAGLSVLYIGSVAYLGGRRLAGHLILGILALVTISAPLFLNGSTLDLAAFLLLVSAAALLFGLSRYKGKENSDCQRCGSYRKSGRQFCDYCGKRLREVSFAFPFRRFFALALVSLAVTGLLLGATLPIVSKSSSGLLIASYKLSGVSWVAYLPSYPGWTRSVVGSQGNQTVTRWDYVLAGTGKVNATVSLSPSRLISAREALGSHVGITQNGASILPTGHVAVTYRWSDGKYNYTGLLMESQVTYFSGGRVAESYAAFFFAQRGTPQESQKADAAMSVEDATSSALQNSRSGYLVLVAVIGPVISNFQYVLLLASGVFFAIVGGIARDADSAAMRMIENSLSLDRVQFEALAAIASRSNRTTGARLLGEVDPAGKWEEFRVVLERLTELGLVSRIIAIERGIPKTFWVRGLRT